jgi:hypothetical protein
MAEDGEEVSMLPTPGPKYISFDNLGPTRFEDFRHDLLTELGLLGRNAIREVSEAGPC